MSTVADIRAAIVSRLSGVTDVGVVQPYQRYAVRVDQLKPIYTSTAYGLRGWHVRRHATQELGNVQGRTVEHIVWKLVGVMALDDAIASELTFDALIESVRNAFASDQTLGGTVDQCALPDEAGGESGLQLEACGPAMFAGVLSHVAHLRLNTLRYLERQP